MKKLTVTFLVAGVALAIGGILFLYTKGYNIWSVQPWESVFKLMIWSPSTLIGAAFDNSKAEVVRGFTAVVFGCGIALFGVIIFIASSLTDAMRSSAKIARSSREIHKNKSNSNSRTKKSKKINKWRTFRISMPFRGDRSVPLEDGFFSKQKDRVPKLISSVGTLIEKYRKKTSPSSVIVRSADNNEVIAEIPSATEFHRDLLDWHTRVKSSGGYGSDLVEEAKQIRARANEQCLRHVREEDPMNSEFMIRMVNAWADKLDNVVNVHAESHPINADREMTALTSAIQDVSRNGVSVEGTDDEEAIDLEDGADESFLSPGTYDQVIDGAEVTIVEEDSFLNTDDFDTAAKVEAMVDHVTDLDGSDEDAVDAKSASGSLEGEMPEGTESGVVDSIISAAFVYIQEVKIVSDGEGEWSEELADQQSRVIALEEVIEGVRGLLGKLDDDDFLALMAEHENEPEWDWLAEIRGDIDREKNRIMDLIVDEDSADDSDEDIESSFSMNSPELSAKKGEAESEEGVKSEHSDGEDPEPVVKVDRPISPENEIPDESPEAVKATADVSKAVVEPEDVSVGDLTEVEYSDEALMKWGMMAKAAGAAEAKLVHVILDREGSKRKAVGVVHMVAGWRSESTEDLKKMNIIFRYVPEGDWNMIIDAGVRMVDQEGNWVGVDAAILSHSDVVNHKTIIHFHGPGIADETVKQLRDGLYVSGRIMNADEIKKAVLEN